MKKLIEMATRMGISVHAVHMEDIDPELLGFYDHDAAIIYVDIDLIRAQRMAVIAHELGHAYYSHACGSKAADRQADKFAAELLIDPVLYAAAEKISDVPQFIATELDVTVDVIEDYRRYCLQRLGRITYGRSWRTGISRRLAAELAS